MIEYVISGGQTGCDQAGWRSAVAAGYRTGGWTPCGFATERPDGHGVEYHPEFAGLYGARELELGPWQHSLVEQYRVRTKRNVRDADLTILFGSWTSAGSKLAYRLFREKAGEAGKDPGIGYLRDGWIPVTWGGTHGLNWQPADVAGFIARMPHRVVGIAGNRASASPGLGERVERYLAEVFGILKGQR